MTWKINSTLFFLALKNLRNNILSTISLKNRASILVLFNTSNLKQKKIFKTFNRGLLVSMILLSGPQLKKK